MGFCLIIISFRLYFDCIMRASCGWMGTCVEENMMSKACRRLVLCLGILIMSSVTAIGQLTTGTITGTVTDQSGAAVPGATVSLKNTDTGISRTVQTGENGKYDALSLPAGSYEISASLSGFQTMVHTGFSLAVGQNVAVDFSLRVGSVSEAVTVTGETAQVETTTATVSNLVA